MNERGTPRGGNAGQQGMIGLSKVCQIFGAARVDTAFVFCWHLTVSWPWDWITSVRRSLHAPTGWATAQGNTANSRERAYRHSRLKPCCSGC